MWQTHGMRKGSPATSAPLKWSRQPWLGLKGSIIFCSHDGEWQIPVSGALRAAVILGVFVHRSEVVVKFVVKIEKDI